MTCPFEGTPLLALRMLDVYRGTWGQLGMYWGQVSLRNALKLLGTLLVAVAAIGFGVFGGYALEHMVPRPSELEGMLNRAGEVHFQTNTLSRSADGAPIAMFQTKDDETIRLCRVINLETSELECGPWSNDAGTD